MNPVAAGHTTSSTAEPGHPSRPTPGATLPFRIVGHHQHRAVVGPDTYCCIRESTATDAGFTIRWSAYKNDARLKADCRTLNEAKRLCRAATAETAAPAGPAARTYYAANCLPGEQPAGQPIVPVAERCEGEG